MRPSIALRCICLTFERYSKGSILWRFLDSILMELDRLDIKVVPIVVGAVSKEVEAFFGELLAPFLAREDTFCVVSSDFCHWWILTLSLDIHVSNFVYDRGSRFSYTYYYPAPPPSEEPGVRLSRTTLPSPTYRIFESISRLDHEAMELLTLPPSTATDAHTHFGDYLVRTNNTICGRHPIGVLFGALSLLEKESGIQPTVKWVRYEQSSACHTIKDSSVSYASAWVRF
jgi:AmmeMemoRadiSam system protein B